jgi:hypothetical protein
MTKVPQLAGLVTLGFARIEMSIIDPGAQAREHSARDQVAIRKRDTSLPLQATVCCVAMKWQFEL